MTGSCRDISHRIVSDPNRERALSLSSSGGLLYSRRQERPPGAHIIHQSHECFDTPSLPRFIRPRPCGVSSHNLPGSGEADEQGRDKEASVPPIRRAAYRVGAHALLRRAQDGVHIFAGRVRHGLRLLRHGAGDPRLDALCSVWSPYKHDKYHRTPAERYGVVMLLCSRAHGRVTRFPCCSSTCCFVRDRCCLSPGR